MKKVVHYRLVTDRWGNAVLNDDLRAKLIPGTVVWILWMMLQAVKGEWCGYHSLVQSFVLYLKASKRLENWEDSDQYQLRIALGDLVEFGALEVREFD
jgi:hypothetical protein